VADDLLQELERAALLVDANRRIIEIARVAAKIFRADPALAFARLAPYFAPERLAARTGQVIADGVLRQFSPSSFTYQKGHETPRWSDAAAPQWFQKDPRWLELCVALRRDERLGCRARNVLRFADPAAVRMALAQARLREGPRVIPWQSAAPGNLLVRYRGGEHEGVWRELRHHAAIAGALREEALLVARETMRRVARCCDVLAERLEARGWQSLSALRTLPDARDVAIFGRIEALTDGPLPPSLQAFWEIVGGVDFIWDYNGDGEAPDFGLGLALREMDPLCVGPAASAPSDFERWVAMTSPIDPELNDPFKLYLAPDQRTKDNISGGEPYGIELPFLGADPEFDAEPHGLPFVDYLRLALRWGGFPDLEHHAKHTEVRAFVAEMTRDLEPF
jgi:hypothetical protein